MVRRAQPELLKVYMKQKAGHGWQVQVSTLAEEAALVLNNTDGSQ